MCEINKLVRRITCSNDPVANVNVNGMDIDLCEEHVEMLLKKAGSVSESPEAERQRRERERRR